MRETFITLLFSEIDRVAVDLNEKRIIVHGPSGKSLPRNHRFHKAMGVGGAVACCCTQLDSRHTESSINFPLPVPYPSTGTPAFFQLCFHLFEGGKVAAAPFVSLFSLLRNMVVWKVILFLFFHDNETPSRFTRSRTIEKFEKFEKFNLVAISRVVRWFPSFDFILSSIGLPERGH